MPRSPRPQVTYDRLLQETWNSLRVGRAILQVETLAEAQVLAAGLVRQLTRYLPPEPAPKKRR